MQVGVIGLGLMGHGIAQVTAAKGIQVVAVDANKAAVERGIGMIKKSLETVAAKAVSKGTLDAAGAKAQVDATLGRIKTSTERVALKECDLVIEAAPEDLAVKEALYKELPGVVRKDAIVATNTSGLEVGLLADWFGEKQRVIGLHYFNPVRAYLLSAYYGNELVLSRLR